MGSKHYPVRMFSDGMDDFVMGEKTLKATPGVAGLQSVAMTTMSRRFLSCCFKTVTFAKNASRRCEHWQGHSEKYCSWRFAKTEDLFALYSTLFDITWQSSSSLWPNEKWLCSTILRIRQIYHCWLLFVPKSEIPLEGAHLWLVSGHPESRDKYIKHHCKGRLLQGHPEAVWPYKSVCTVTRDLCRKLNNKVSLLSRKYFL